jgi:hypothetical protein
MIISVIGMTHVSSITKNKLSKDDLWGELGLNYILLFGELGETSEFTNTQWIFFILFSFFALIVMLNMLIAIVGETFCEFQANSDAINVRALNNLLIEAEIMIRFKLYYF